MSSPRQLADMVLPWEIDCKLPMRATTTSLTALALCVEAERLIVDAHLDLAKRWRGQMRREVHGYAQPDEVARYVTAYDELISAASRPFWKLDADTIREIHDAAVGGLAFRTVQLTVGGHHSFPAASNTPALLEEVLAKAVRSEEPIAVSAARLHLNLLTIHPFLDGNGRTARLTSTLLLVSGGFRSTLLTAVEQHFHATPGKYIEMLDQYRYGEITEDECVAGLLHAMIANAMYAAWFRKRETRLRAACAALGISSTETTNVLIAYDSNPAPSGDAAMLAEALADKESPLHRINQTATAEVRAELAFQVGVLLDEEQTCAQDG
jgi:hypothetical protein